MIAGWYGVPLGDLHLRGRVVALGKGPLIMGVLNVTPDSFSDGGHYLDPGRAAARAEELVAEGADLLDIGGESSRPGARAVPAEEELRRVLPVLEAIRPRLPVPISVDTRRAEVARRVLDAGADAINDITGLTGDPAMAPLVAAAGAGVVIMHMQGTPLTMQDDPRYDDVVGEIAAFFARQARRAEEAGIDPRGILLDPGLGFGKTTAHNLTLLGRLHELGRLGRPILVGPSRKAFLGQLLDRPVADRLEGTIAACLAAAAAGAAALRVHDVGPVARALRVWRAIRAAGLGPPDPPPVRLWRTRRGRQADDQGAGGGA